MNISEDKIKELIKNKTKGKLQEELLTEIEKLNKEKLKEILISFQKEKEKEKLLGEDEAFKQMMQDLKELEREIETDEDLKKLEEIE